MRGHDPTSPPPMSPHRVRVRRWGRAVVAAVAFLTRVPVGRQMLDAADVARGTPLFPVVGAILGVLVAGLGLALHDGARLPATLAASVAVAAGTALTGGMHLDALADSMDALGVPDRDRALTVMKDPRVGSFGAIAISLALLVQTTALAALLAGHRAPALLAGAYALARAMPLAAGVRLPYARRSASASAGAADVAGAAGGRPAVVADAASGGAGRIVTDRTSPGRALAAVLVAVAVAVGAGRLTGVAMVGASVVVTAVWSLLCRRRFGGFTGDTMGANIELCALTCLATAVAIPG